MFWSHDRALAGAAAAGAAVTVATPTVLLTAATRTATTVPATLLRIPINVHSLGLTAFGLLVTQGHLGARR